MLINGAAAIALLTFLGNLASNELESNTSVPYAIALLCFTTGTFVAAIDAASTLLLNVEAMVGFNNDEPSDKFRTLGVVTSLLVLAALILFALGVLFSFLAIFNN